MININKIINTNKKPIMASNILGPVKMPDISAQVKRPDNPYNISKSGYNNIPNNFHIQGQVQGINVGNNLVNKDKPIKLDLTIQTRRNI